MAPTTPLQLFTRVSGYHLTERATAQAFTRWPDVHSFSRFVTNVLFLALERARKLVSAGRAVNATRRARRPAEDTEERL